jgi:hypothetical protein
MSIDKQRDNGGNLGTYDVYFVVNWLKGIILNFANEYTPLKSARMAMRV